MTSMVYTVLLNALRPQVLSHSAAEPGVRVRVSVLCSPRGTRHTVQITKHNRIEFLRIARCSSDINSFISTAHTFFNRMKNQGGNIRQILGLLEKIKTRYPDVLGKYRMDLNRIKSRIRSGKN